MFHQDKKIQLSKLLSHVLSKDVSVSNIQMQGGGCINKAAVLETSEGKMFVKWNYSNLHNMFDVEVKGLEILRSAGEMVIPNVLGLIEEHDESFLFLEMIEPQKQEPRFWADFGVRLAKLHRHTSRSFGLEYDNYIGSLPQKNNQMDSWVDFFYQNRLMAQLNLAFENHKMDRSIMIHFENLYKRLNEILPVEAPALLHGDLWGGNVLKATDGTVSLIDPAVYYGHREMEMAYTKLFDNNPIEFYWAYNEEFPLASGFKERIEIYNLYPLLVHVNLFGGGYVNQVKKIVSKY